MATNYCFFVSIMLFVMAFSSLFMTRKHIITFIVAVELMFLAAAMNFAAFSINLQDMSGQVFAVVILAVAAAKAAVGLAIAVVYRRLSDSIDLQSINLLKG